MAHPSKRIGDDAELEIAKILADLTGWPVRRKLGAGRLDDTGDLDGIPQSTVQVKRYRTDIVRSIRETLAELPGQQTNAGTPFGFGLIRRPRRRNMAPHDEWFAVLNLHQLCTLLREATTDD
jgi:hypothetical protein